MPILTSDTALPRRQKIASQQAFSTRRDSTWFGSTTTIGQVLSGLDLSSKTAVLTGGNSGLGLELVKELAAHGARVLFTSRNIDKGHKVIADLKSAGVKGELACEQLELTDLKSVEAFAERAKQESSIDYLLLNAGIAFIPKQYTQDGFERQLASNHIGHFHLTQLLTEKLKSQAHASRIVVTSSTAHNGARLDIDDLHFQNRFVAYGQSKLANILFVKEFASRNAGSNVSAFAVHPGTIATNVVRYLGPLSVPFSAAARLLGNSEQTATATHAYACVAPELDGHSGAYLSACSISPPSSAAQDPQLAKRLWDVTAAQIEEALQRQAV